MITETTPTSNTSNEPRTYWNGNGKHQEAYNKLFEELVPATGEATTEAGELLRIASRFYYEWFNNGNCNATEAYYPENEWGDPDWDDEPEGFSASERYLEEAETFTGICQRHTGQIFTSAAELMEAITAELEQDQEWRWRRERQKTEKLYEDFADAAVEAAILLHKESQEAEPETKGMTLDELHEAVEASNERENEIFDFIVENDIATREEIVLVTSINGYTEETLNDIIRTRTGYRSKKQAIECEPEAYARPEDHKKRLLVFIDSKWKGASRQEAAENFEMHSLIGENAERSIYALAEEYTQDNDLEDEWWGEFFDDADDIYREL